MYLLGVSFQIDDAACKMKCLFFFLLPVKTFISNVLKQIYFH